MIDKIIPSKTRRKILELLFHHPDQSFYLRKVVREVGEEVNAVKRELDILTEAKVLNKEKRLNKVFFTLNKNWRHYEDFLRIFAKSNLLSTLFYENLSRMGKIKYASLSMKFVKRQPIKDDEVYFLVVGVVVVPEIQSIVTQVEKKLNQEINYTVMTEEEFVFRKKNNDPFIWRFLKYPKVMLLGSEEDFLK